VSARTQSILAGLAAVAALVSYLAVHRPPSDAPGGHYDERGHWVVPIPPKLQKRLESRTAAPGHPRESAILDRVEKKIRGLLPDQVREALLSFPPGSRYVWATFWVEAEVENGGFDQYFANGHGVAARIAAEGFRALGVEKYAVLVEKAIVIHESGPGAAVPNPRYEEIDDAFYDLEDLQPLPTLRAKYIDAHPEEFPE